MRYSKRQCRGISAIGANSLLVEGSLKSFRLSVLNLTLARIILHTPKLQFCGQQVWLYGIIDRTKQYTAVFNL